MLHAHMFDVAASMKDVIMTTCFLSIETFANVTIVTNVIDTNYKKYHILDLEVSSLSLVLKKYEGREIKQY